MPWIIGILAVLLVAAGVIILVISLGQGGSIIPPPATATATVTNTFTVTATVPSATPTATSTQTLTPTATVTVTPLGPFEYTVQDKDTCWDLAIKYKVDLPALLALNNFAVGTCPIAPGQKIMIPAPGQTLPTATPQDVSKLPAGTLITYTLQLGDTLRAIALTYHSTQDAIMKANPTITDANKLVAGQTIKVPVNIATPVPTLGPTSTKSGPTSTVAPPTATVTKTQ
ncbi:MAG TPA: LysM peptidoglycan-binding domain-containing protein [Anaerolineaceae bacterium]|nr:LysM peptidoglycan-binding domain-containing protein [Anaerolineaceae bacterium]